MSLLWKTCRFIKRCGAPARFVATSILSCVAPRPVTELAEKLIDRSLERSHDDVHSFAAADDLAAMERVFEILRDLDPVIAGLATCDSNAERAKEKVAAWAVDGCCRGAIRDLAELIWTMSASREIQSRLANLHDGLSDLGRRVLALPLDYLDEENLLGFSRMPTALAQINLALAALFEGSAADAEAGLLSLCRQQPRSAVLAVGYAAALFAAGKHHEGAESLARAHRLRPDDATLEQLSDVATRHSGPMQIDRSPQPRHRHRPHTGDVLDGWLLEKRLGRGGWGRVYRASKDGKVRAVKILHSELTDNPVAAKRFQREITILAGLAEHPHLVRIDSGHLFRRCPKWACCYFAMEMVEGLSLDSYLEHFGPLSYSAVCKHFIGVTEALALAHWRGVVHRDIKPGNILVRAHGDTGKGRLVLADFGLAGTVRRPRRSASWTALFAAPEQFRTGITDLRSDVFSLAATIYYCLMFADPVAKTRFKAKLLGKRVPLYFREFLERCLDNDPDERPADAAEFLKAWRELAPPRTRTSEPEITGTPEGA